MRRIPWLTAVAVLLALFPLAVRLVPSLQGSTWLLSKGIDVFIFAVYALSYDLLMGVTGIVSFGHALFFGAGTYAVALTLVELKAPVWAAVPLALLLSVALAAAVGALSLRVRGHFFAMITLAFAELGHLVAQKWYRVTGGADGLNVPVPRYLYNKELNYYLALALMVLAYLAVRRMADSPVGKVWTALRENEFRAGALGFNAAAYKVGAFTIAGAIAGLAGAAHGLLSTQFASPHLLSPDQTIQALLMTIIGGVGTLHGPMFGAAVVRLLATYLSGLRSIHPLFARWPLLFGLIYIAIVIFLPKGLAGLWQPRAPRPVGDKAA